MNSIKCPECNRRAFAEFVDVGVGFSQVEPYHCDCGWTESCHYSSIKACKKCKSNDYCTNQPTTLPLQQFKDDLTLSIYETTKTEAHKKGICIQCKEEALPKCHSDLGRKEYEISGLCEECFDYICKE